jgi:nitronate monooxygenase
MADFRTPLCDLLQIDVPVLNAPMGGVAGGALAAAVSEAGGLGLIAGMGHGGPEQLRSEIRLARARTQRPFGVGFISWRLPAVPDLYEVALAERVPVIAHSFVDPAPYMAAARAVGATVLCQVQTVTGALAAAAAGVDAIVAQGTEGGGHTGTSATLPLVPQVVDAVAPVPVLAAGGIADGRGLAAVLMLGAVGAWLGTAFYAAEESLTSPAKKQALLGMGADATIRTSAYDIARGQAWPAGIALRVGRNQFTARWHGREADLQREQEQVERELAAATAADDIRSSPVVVGEVAGLVRAAEPAGTIVRRVVAEAERTLQEWSRTVLGLVPG